MLVTELRSRAIRYYMTIFFFISIIFLSVNFIGRTHGVMNKFPDRQKNRIDDENESVNYKNKFISYCEISQILLFILALSLAPL